MANQKLTKLQWWSLGYDINDDAEGVEEWNNGWCSFMVTRYTENEVHPSEAARRKWREHRNEIARRSREKIAREKAAREAEEAWEEEFRNDYYTAWQMLSQTRRVPIDGQDFYRKKWWFKDEWEDEWFQSVYYYYDIKRSRRVSDEEYQQLKDLYVEKYGGWEKIDLDHTTYDGRAWW